MEPKSPLEAGTTPFGSGKRQGLATWSVGVRNGRNYPRFDDRFSEPMTDYGMSGHPMKTAILFVIANFTLINATYTEAQTIYEPYVFTTIAGKAGSPGKTDGP